MAAVATSPLQVSRDERRKTLSRHFIATIEPLLEAGGSYGDLSVERLVKPANISRSTFYVYFDDKGDLLRVMAENLISDMFDAAEAWWTFPAAGSKRDLRAALRPSIDTYRTHRAIFGAVSESAASDPRVREQQQNLIDRVAANLASHISECQSEGTIAPELDPERTAQWLIWMIERGLYQRVSPARDPEAEKLLDAVTDVVWRTLYAGYRD